MTGQASPRSSLPPPSLPRELVARTRIATLHEELAATSDAYAQALLELELGALYEHGLDDRAEALSCYRSAHGRRPDLLAPLLSIARVAFDQPALASEAWQAFAAISTAPRDRADALCEAGILLCDQLGAKERGAALFRQALEEDPSCSTAALLLEYEERSGRDANAAERANAIHAHAASDVEFEASLLLEVAAAEQRAGRGDAALARLHEASELGARTRAVWSATERIARANHQPERVLAALDALGAEARASELAASTAGQPLERPRSAALWRQASRVADALRAAGSDIARRHAAALECEARDPLVLWEQIVSLQAHEQPRAALSAARTLLDVTGEVPLAAAVHVRYAELLEAAGDPALALAQRRQAVLCDGGSAQATAAFEDAALRERRAQLLCDHLQVRAERNTRQARAEHLLHAGRIAVLELADTERGLALLRRAVECAPAPETALRTLYAAAVWSGDEVAASDAAQALCGRKLDPAERAALRFDQYARLRRAGDTDSALALLEAALLEPSNAGWAADAARLQGAARHSHRLLADAHRVLSLQSPDPAHSAAHLCAAARALLRSGEAKAAITELRTALSRAPGDAYALALLEECLLACGEGREAARMLRDAAQSHENARRRELALLHAGAAAEAVFDAEAAAHSYLEAAALDNGTLAPLWALRRLAERGGDGVLLLRALEQTAARGEHTAIAQLELGELLLGRGRFNEASAALANALPDAQLGPAAALGLWLLPDAAVSDQLRAQAERTLAESAGAQLKPSLVREGIAAQLRRTPERAHAALITALDDAGTDRWLAYGALATSQTQAERADAFLRLGSMSEDTGIGAELILHSTRTNLLARGAAAADECALRALQTAQNVPGSLSAALALDESLWAGDDAESRAEALFARIAHASNEAIPMLRTARARALLAAGRAREASDAARRTLAEDSDDLAAYELLRVAGRVLGDFASVAQAAQRLAAHADGHFRTLLLEEAADALEREPGQEAEAEACLRAAFDHEPTTEIAFAKLHDALIDRTDLPGLIALLEQRIAVLDDPGAALDLRYERALALRADGRKQEAVVTLDQVLAEDPAHSAALGLLVETCTALEDWKTAVSALRRLAEAPVPLAQKRVARLGAAEFLEHRLGDAGAACAELQALDAIGVRDHAVLVRLAGLCERAEQFRQAVDAYRRAAAQVSGTAAAALELRAGDVLHEHLGAQNEALLAYTRALAADPLHVAACARLLERTEQRIDRDRILADFERPLRALLEREPARPDLLRLLLQLGQWGERTDIELVALSALSALGASDTQEQEALARASDKTQAFVLSGRGDDALRRLGSAAAHAPLARAAQLLSGVLGAFDSERETAPEPMFTLAAQLAAANSGVQRFEAGRQALARALGVWPLCKRTRAAQREALRACLSLAGRAQGLPAIDEFGKRIGRQLARADRKELIRLLAAPDQGEVQIESYLDILDDCLVRAGVLLAGDVSVAWSRGAPLSGSARDLELLRFWSSPRLLELRRELGAGS